MKNKGQTAMEYLMTYGWAILIIIVVVAALYAMGVFSVKGGVACSPCFSYFAYRDYDQSTAGGGTVYLRNGARTVEITVNSGGSLGAATLCGTLTCGTPEACSPGTDIVIDTITTTGNQLIDITYKDCDTLVDHTDTATIHNK